MKKCLKIVLSGDISPKLMVAVQKEAKRLNLEGVAHVDKETGDVRIVVCGDKDDADGILDVLHKESAALKLDITIEVEPFLRDKDYRGVFRVIE
jgi:acylphosphatase